MSSRTTNEEQIQQAVADADFKAGSFAHWDPQRASRVEKFFLGSNTYFILSILVGFAGVVGGIASVLSVFGSDSPLPGLGGMVFGSLLAFGAVKVTSGAHRFFSSRKGFVRTSAAGWTLLRRAQTAYQQMERIAGPDELAVADDLSVQVERLANRERDLAIEQCGLMGWRTFADDLDEDERVRVSAAERRERAREDYLHGRRGYGSRFSSRSLTGQRHERFEKLEAERYATMEQIARGVLALEDLSQTQVATEAARVHTRRVTGLDDAQLLEAVAKVTPVDTSAVEESIRKLRHLEEAYGEVYSKEARLRA